MLLILLILIKKKSNIFRIILFKYFLFLNIFTHILYMMIIKIRFKDERETKKNNKNLNP